MTKAQLFKLSFCMLAVTASSFLVKEVKAKSTPTIELSKSIASFGPFLQLAFIAFDSTVSALADEQARKQALHLMIMSIFPLSER